MVSTLETFFEGKVKVIKRVCFGFSIEILPGETGKPQGPGSVTAKGRRGCSEGQRAATVFSGGEWAIFGWCLNPACLDAPLMP